MHASRLHGGTGLVAAGPQTPAAAAPPSPEARPPLPPATPAGLAFAARRAAVLSWTLQQVDVYGGSHTLAVGELLLDIRAELLARLPGAQVTVFIAGSACGWLLNPDWQQAPSDLDPLLVVDIGRAAAAGDTMAAGELAAHFSAATEHALERRCGAPVSLRAVQRLGAAAPADLLVRRIGTWARHVDLRLCRRSSRVQPYDFVANAGLISWAALKRASGARADKATRSAPHADPVALQTIDGRPADVIRSDLALGLYRFDHELLGTSIYRVWKARSRGLVPAARDEREEALLERLFAALQPMPTEVERSFSLNLAEFVARVAEVGVAASSGAILANAIVHVAVLRAPQQRTKQSAESERQRGALLSALREVLGASPTGAAAGAEALAALRALLATDDGVARLLGWLTLLAEDAQEGFVTAPPGHALAIRRVLAQEQGSEERQGAVPHLRAFLPALGAWLVAPCRGLWSFGSALPNVSVVFALPLADAVASLLGFAVERPGGLLALTPAQQWLAGGGRERLGMRLRRSIAALSVSDPQSAARAALACVRLLPKANLTQELAALTTSLGGDPLVGGLRALLSRHALAQAHLLLAQARAPAAGGQQIAEAFEQCLALLGHMADAERSAFEQSAEACLQEVLPRLPSAAYAPAARLVAALRKSASLAFAAAAPKLLPHLAKFARAMRGQQGQTTADSLSADGAANLLAALKAFIDRSAHGQQGAAASASPGMVAARQAIAAGQMDAACKLLGAQKKRLRAGELPGHEATQLLMKCSPQLYACYPKLFAELLHLLAEAKAAPDALLQDCRRLPLLLKDPANLLSVARLFGSASCHVAAEVVDAWMLALMAPGAPREAALQVLSPPSHPWVTSEVVRIADCPTHRQGLAVLVEGYGARQQASIGDAFGLNSIALLGLLVLAPKRGIGGGQQPLGVAAAMLEAWQAALRAGLHEWDASQRFTIALEFADLLASEGHARWALRELINLMQPETDQRTLLGARALLCVNNLLSQPSGADLGTIADYFDHLSAIGWTMDGHQEAAAAFLQVAVAAGQPELGERVATKVYALTGADSFFFACYRQHVEQQLGPAQQRLRQRLIEMLRRPAQASPWASRLAGYLTDPPRRFRRGRREVLLPEYALLTELLGCQFRARNLLDAAVVPRGDGLAAMPAKSLGSFAEKYLSKFFTGTAMLASDACLQMVPLLAAFVRGGAGGERQRRLLQVYSWLDVEPGRLVTRQGRAVAKPVVTALIALTDLLISVEEPLSPPATLAWLSWLAASVADSPGLSASLLQVEQNLLSTRSPPLVVSALLARLEQQLSEGQLEAGLGSAAHAVALLAGQGPGGAPWADAVMRGIFGAWPRFGANSVRSLAVLWRQAVGAWDDKAQALCIERYAPLVPEPHRRALLRPGSKAVLSDCPASRAQVGLLLHRLITLGEAPAAAGRLVAQLLEVLPYAADCEPALRQRWDGHVRRLCGLCDATQVKLLRGVASEARADNAQQLAALLQWLLQQVRAIKPLGQLLTWRWLEVLQQLRALMPLSGRGNWRQLTLDVLGAAGPSASVLAQEHASPLSEVQVAGGRKYQLFEELPPLGSRTAASLELAAARWVSCRSQLGVPLPGERASDLQPLRAALAQLA